MLLRAEIWWLWQLLVCFFAYHISLIAGLDWMLLIVYLLGNYAYVSWIRAQLSSKGRCVACIFISQLPILAICAAAFCVLGKVFYADALIVLLQLSSAVFYPINAFMPNTFLNDFQVYLWSAAILLSLQSLVMLIIALRIPKINDPRNSYIEHETIEVATKATRVAP